MAGRTSGRVMLEAKRSAGSLMLLIAVIVFALATLAIIASKLTFERPWNSYESVKVAVTDAKGIFPGGDSVRIHGVVVGVVANADLTNQHPVLTLDILRKYGAVYKNAQLRIRPVTPLQDLYVNILSRGTPSAGVASNTGYVIPATQTQVPVDISRILDTFNADTRTRLTTLLSELGKGLPDGGVQLRAAFSQLAPFLQVADQATLVLRQHQQDVKQVIHQFGTFSKALADRNTALNQFIQQGDVTTSELAAHSSALSSTLQQIAALLPTVRSSFASVNALTGTLDPALTSLSPVTAHLQSGLNALGRLGTEALPALRALRPAVYALRGMAVQLAPTSVSLNSAFRAMTPEAPQYSAVVNGFAPCMTTLENFLNNTMSVLKFQDANGAFPRADETVNLDTGGGAVGYAGINNTPIPDCSGAVR
ncbi:MAG: MlaD family protein [Solirubrobacteraceae bacterium]